MKRLQIFLQAFPPIFLVGGGGGEKGCLVCLLWYHSELPFIVIFHNRTQYYNMITVYLHVRPPVP
jgi:hypothetical protein